MKSKPSKQAETGLIEACLTRWAESDPDREAFLDQERRLSYRQSADLVERIARALLSEGIQRGDRVAVFGYSRLECFAAFLGISAIGAIYVGMNPKHTPRELGHVLTDADPKLLFMMTASDNDPAIVDLVAALPEMTVVALDTGHSRASGWATFEAWLERAETVPTSSLRRAMSAVARDDAAAIIYTSGTTGIPKGALIPHRALLHAADLSSKSMWKGRPRTIVDLPISHVAWLIETCLAAVFAGGTLYFRERFDPVETLRIVERERLDSLLLISSMLIACTRVPEFKSCDLSSIDRLLFVAPVEAELLEEMRDRCGATLVTGLGMTETAGGYTFTDDDADLETLVTTVGRADPSVDVKLVNDGGAPVDKGEPGEILVRGESIFLGYLNRPDATSDVLDKDGFLHTGDVAVMRPDGNIRVVGRRKEMFKSGGYNVYPTEIEMVIAGHPEVAMVAVVSTADDFWGEVGVAFVVPSAGGHLAEADLDWFCREKLANYKVPKRFVIRADLPVLSNGKIDRASLKLEVPPI